MTEGSRATQILIAGLLLMTAAGAQSAIDVDLFDTPNDAGGSLSLTWRADAAPAGSLYRVYLAESPEGPFHLAAEAMAPARMSDEPALFGYDDANAQRYLLHLTGCTPEGEETPRPLEDGRTYHVRLVAGEGAESRRSHPAAAAPAPNLFNTAKLNNLVLAVALSVVILLFIAVARRRELYIRRIGGLEALDEALGRATEMGRSVLFVHGLKGMDQIPTIAAVNILGRVARRTARLDAELRVANVDPVVMSVSQEVVKEACLEEGRPDAYRPGDVFMAGTEQFSYAAALEGIMVRDRPAAHIMMGYFYAESLLLTETGSTTGAIQIAGTDAYTQLPFFVTTCDYTLMGEELYAASAYLSKEPRLLGSLRGQDVGKAALILVLIAGTVLSTAGVDFLTHLSASL
ncbi:MAG: hypothetical protein OXG13_21095 [Gemmatimonadaceae bacterium]|nr:hypothetical protein [Gemmatimonadaceae bacterium]